MVFVRYQDETDENAKILLMYNQLDEERNYYQEPGGEFFCQYQSEMNYLAKQNAIKELFEESAMTIKLKLNDKIVGPILVNNRYLCFIAYIVLSRHVDLLNEMRKNYKVIEQSKYNFDYSCRECTDWEFVDAFNVPQMIGDRVINNRPFDCLKQIYISQYIDFEKKKINLSPIYLNERIHSNSILKENGGKLFTNI